MATLTRKNSKVSKVNSGRSFDESCKESYTLEEFVEEMGIKGGVQLIENPKSVNEATGENNIFMLFRSNGKDQTGSVANKVQQKIRSGEGLPEDLMIGLFQTDGGEEIYTLFERGNGGNVLFTLGE